MCGNLCKWKSRRSTMLMNRKADDGKGLERWKGRPFSATVLASRSSIITAAIPFIPFPYKPRSLSVHVDGSIAVRYKHIMTKLVLVVN